MRKLHTNELNRLSVEEYKNVTKHKMIIVLDNIRSQNNTGSIFRTSDAFLIEEIHLCGITATPPHREIHKTALGATESVSWKYFPNTIDSITALKKKGYIVYGLEQTDSSISIDKFIPDPASKIALVFGNEVEGIDNKVLAVLDACIEIPQYGTKHSLNVSVVAGIVIWQILNKRILG